MNGDVCKPPHHNIVSKWLRLTCIIQRKVASLTPRRCVLVPNAVVLPKRAENWRKDNDRAWNVCACCEAVARPMCGSSLQVLSFAHVTVKHRRDQQVLFGKDRSEASLPYVVNDIQDDYFPHISKSKESTTRFTRTQAKNRWHTMKLQAYFTSYIMLEMIRRTLFLGYLAWERERRAPLKV